MSLIKPKKIASSTLKTRAMTVKITEALMTEWDAITQRLDARGYEVESFQCVMADSFALLLEKLKREEAALSKPATATQPKAVVETAAESGKEELPKSQPDADTQQKTVVETAAESGKEELPKSQPDADTQPENVYIDVPVPDNTLVKSLGGKWDNAKKSWYVPPGLDLKLFKKWPQKKV